MISNEQQHADESSGRHDHAVHAIHRLVEQQVALFDRSERLSWLEAIFNNFPGQIYVKDSQGRYSLCNRTVLNYHNLVEEDEIIGKTDFDLYPAERASENLTIEQHLLRTGKPLLNLEEESVGPDGRGRCLLVSKIPVSAADGVPGGLIGFAFDISDRKDIENLMLGQANMLGMVARSLPLEDIVSRVIVFIEGQMPAPWGRSSSYRRTNGLWPSRSRRICRSNIETNSPCGPSVRRPDRSVRRRGPVRP